MTWKQSVHTLVRALGENPRVALFDAHIGEPAADAEIALVHQRLGFELDPRFLDYFRQCNGLRLRWIELMGPPPSELTGAFFDHHRSGLNCGSINIPSLAALFPLQMDYRFNRRDDFIVDEHRLPILGGFCEATLRDRLRPFDDYLQSPSDSSFHNVALIADARYPDPICILTEDYSAALSDCSPMRARTYLDFVVASCGLTRARHRGMKAHGYAGNHPIVESIPRLGNDPEEFLGYLLDKLSLERSMEIAGVFESL